MWGLKKLTPAMRDNLMSISIGRQLLKESLEEIMAFLNSVLDNSDSNEIKKVDKLILEALEWTNAIGQGTASITGKIEEIEKIETGKILKRHSYNDLESARKNFISGYLERRALIPFMRDQLMSISGGQQLIEELLEEIQNFVNINIFMNSNFSNETKEKCNELLGKIKESNEFIRQGTDAIKEKIETLEKKILFKDQNTNSFSGDFKYLENNKFLQFSSVPSPIKKKKTGQISLIFNQKFSGNNTSPYLNNGQKFNSTKPKFKF